MFLRFIFILGFLSMCSISNGQPWLAMDEKDNENKNFYEIQKKFEAYWKDRPITKGSGYKPFKRWEYYWSSRVDSKGNFPPPNIKQVEWEKYKRSFKKENKGIRAGAWTSLGPSSTPAGYAGIGRVSAIAFHPNNSNIIFVGTPGGGLWKSTNNGDNWTPLTDNIISHLGISGIVIHPTNPNIMYLGTGDPHGYDTNSLGVLKSTDGGTTWNTTGLNWTISSYLKIRKLIMDPDNNNALIAATNNGIYRTTDQGVNWTQIITGDFFDVVANPNASSNTFYASTQDKIYRSTNNAGNFTLGHTIAGSGRINLAVTAANTNYLYAVSSKSSDNGFNVLVRSTDAGANFSNRSTSPNILGYDHNGTEPGGQGWYDLCIAVDPTNANTVYVGGVNIWKSIDGGTNWNLNTFWFSFLNDPVVHADKHVFTWQNNTTLWNGNDGGIYRTNNGGSTWTDKSNTLVHSQIYRIGVSQTDNKVITGLQDNGTKLKNIDNIWSDVLGGDGMECNIDQSNSNIQYGCIQNGVLMRTMNNWVSYVNIKDSIRNGLQGSWITPHEIDPTTPSTIYAAYDSLYKSTDRGDNWTFIGTSAQIGSGTKTLLKIAPSNSQVIYVGKSNEIYRTEDGGANWTPLNLPGSDISSITIHPTKPLTVWITRSNYSAGQKVYRSFDGGENWTNVSGSLPNLPVNVIIHNDQLEESLYIGMDVGVFYLNHDLQDWIPFSDDLPNVEVFDLNINYNTNTIYAGTYGRGLWSSSLFVPTLAPCSAILNTVINTSYQSAHVSWEPFNASLVSTFEIAVTTSSTPPSSGLKTSEPNYLITGLENNTLYYVHIRANCSNDANSIWKTHSFKTPMSCGQTYSDSGGTTGNYSDFEDITTIICPNATNGARSVTANFIDPFDVETNYDALYIYNGDDNNSTLFSSGNPPTASGYPAGGYYGSTAPGSFTASNPSGCLTMRFRSDETVVGSGYVTQAISCSSGCTNVVSATQNSGANTLREQLNCLSTGSNLFFDAAINGQVISLSAPIVINKDIKITGSFDAMTAINATGAHGVFEIAPGFTVTLENLVITASSANIDAILNNGNLILRNTTIIDPDTTNGNSITNNGVITIKDNVKLN